MAEAHPVGFRWVMKARERGAVIINVDPHYARTSAAVRHPRADPRRHGHRLPRRADPPHHRDEVLLQGVRRPLHQRGDDHQRGLPRHRGPGRLLLGLRSARRASTTATRGATRARRAPPRRAAASTPRRRSATARAPAWRPKACAATRRCSTRAACSRSSAATTRATRPRWSSASAGSRRSCSSKVADTLIANSGRERTTMLTYAVGWTQHSTGVQMIRAGAIVQLLLGNIGRPGGGHHGDARPRHHPGLERHPDALRPAARLPADAAGREGHLTLEDYCTTGGSRRGWWAHFDDYAISLLKAWFGDAATADNDYGFAHMPKISGNHSQFPTMLRDARRRHRRHVRLRPEPRGRDRCTRASCARALAKLDWLVVRDLADIETARFWKDSPEVRSGELRPEDIGTEVFLMPCAGHVEKEGSFTNTQRLLQWRDKALDPPGDARSDLHFVYHLGAPHQGRTTRDSSDPRDWPIRNLTWDYPVHGRHARAERRGGPEGDQRLRDRDRAAGARLLRAARRRLDRVRLLDLLRRLRRRRQPGAPARAGRRRRPPGRLMSRRSGAGPGRTTAASSTTARRPIRRAGRGRSARSTSGGTRSRAEWAGYDVPDFPRDKRPDYSARRRRQGMDAIAGERPVHHDGRRPRAGCTRRAGLLDGPLPTHYEPIESPVAQRALSRRSGANPAAITWKRPENPLNPMESGALPDHRLDVPAHRAPHDGPDEPQPAVAGRAPARDVRRDRPGARRRARGSRTAAGW